METTVFHNANILDCTGKDPYPGTVVVAGDRIQAVGPSDQVTTPRDAVSVDLEGMTLMPGLIDAHTHLGMVVADETISVENQYPGATYALYVAQRIEECLMSGFTTVRDAGMTDWTFKLAVERGLIPGPRMFVSNAFISQTGGHGDLRLRHDRSPSHPPHRLMPCPAICDGEDQVRHVVREQIRTGADQIKVMAGGGVMSPTDAVDVPQFTVEELAAAVYEAKAVKKYVMAHVFTPEGINNCAQAGVTSVEHGTFLDEESAALMRQHSMYLVPTLSIVRLISQRVERGELPDFVADKLPLVRDSAPEAVRIAMDAGVAIASGSDVYGPNAPNRGWEVELKAGIMGPMASIISATRTNAELLGMQEHLGTLEAGKIADLIAVKGNPLDDGSLLKDANNVEMVVQAGRVVKGSNGILRLRWERLA